MTPSTRFVLRIKYYPLVAMSLEEIYAHYHMPTENETTSVFMIPYTKGASGRMKKQEKELSSKTHEYIHLW